MEDNQEIDAELESAIVAGAKYFARYAHNGQFYSPGVPYWEHCEGVARKMKTDEEKVVAYLHDVMEDTTYPPDQLLRLFGKKIYDVLMILTRKEKEKYSDYISRVLKDPMARAVKIADVQYNLDHLSNLPADRAENLYRRYTRAMIRLTAE